MPSSLHDLRSRPGNRLLASLSEEEHSSIGPLLRTVRIEEREVLQEADAPIAHVVFPNNGAASVVAALPDGAMLEIATVGDEGFIGAEAVFSDTAIGRRCVLQVPASDGPTTAELMRVADFRRAYAARGAFHHVINRYMQGLMSQIMRAPVCFGFHSVQERAARWLLLTHDRARADRFKLSQEYLALMLGASRPTVTVAAGILRTAGFINYVHGVVTILDRPGLEAASCDCYAVIKADFQRLGL